MTKKTITFVSIIVITIGAIFLANGLILAWTAPTLPPTGGNVSAPINISGTAQTKSGSLISNTDMRAPLFYDSNNTGYYVDPASTSRINYGIFNNVYSYGWLQSPIFYDANNTGYYVDPASTSRMNAITPNSITLGGVNRTTWPTSAAEADTLDTVADRGATTNQILNVGGIAATGKISNYGSAIYANGMSTYVLNTQHLYPSANNATQAMYLGINNPVDIRGYVYDSGGDFHINDSATVSGGLTVTGSITLGGVPRTTWPTSAAEADTLGTVTARGNTTNSWMQSNSSMRAPLFYDSNNTGYYVDPASTSRINYGIFNNVYSYGWLQSPIFYDANNTGYYVDPASTSKFNAINLGGVSRTTWPVDTDTDTTANQWTSEQTSCYWKYTEHGPGERVGTVYSYAYCSAGYAVTGIWQKHIEYGGGDDADYTYALYCCRMK